MSLSCNFKYNAWKTNLFITKLWVCRIVSEVMLKKMDLTASMTQSI